MPGKVKKEYEGIVLEIKPIAACKNNLTQRDSGRSDQDRFTVHAQAVTYGSLRESPTLGAICCAVSRAGEEDKLRSR